MKNVKNTNRGKKTNNLCDLKGIDSIIWLYLKEVEEDEIYSFIPIKYLRERLIDYGYSKTIKRKSVCKIVEEKLKEYKDIMNEVGLEYSQFFSDDIIDISINIDKIIKKRKGLDFFVDDLICIYGFERLQDKLFIKYLSLIVKFKNYFTGDINIKKYLDEMLFVGKVIMVPSLVCGSSDIILHNEIIIVNKKKILKLYDEEYYGQIEISIKKISKYGYDMKISKYSIRINEDQKEMIQKYYEEINLKRRINYQEKFEQEIEERKQEEIEKRKQEEIEKRRQEKKKYERDMIINANKRARKVIKGNTSSIIIINFIKKILTSNVYLDLKKMVNEDEKIKQHVFEGNINNDNLIKNLYKLKNLLEEEAGIKNYNILDLWMSIVWGITLYNSNNFISKYGEMYENNEFLYERFIRQNYSYITKKKIIESMYVIITYYLIDKHTKFNQTISIENIISESSNVKRRLLENYDTIYEEYESKRFRNLLLNCENSFEKYTIEDIDKMNGHEFEIFIKYLFIQLGYEATITKATRDQGIDVIAIKDNESIGIQTKCYSDSVENSAIQQVVAGKKIYNVNEIMVITNNYFTQQAIELAQVNDVILWDRYELKKQLDENFIFKTDYND
ncbi:MAG: restriction endonuclease [Clostridium sp.]|uniref:restriction endonuclease n=1 Tax=Clostridium sp. TaxID=1506 RepID=UPI002903223D|nr:restriction endonuclease [Clostridium sp.]MDU1586106.1 restriction endonuclease [Clostridium sp.]